jgi:hypothetical protein
MTGPAVVRETGCPYIRHGIGSRDGGQDHWPVKSRIERSCSGCRATIPASTVYVRRYEEYGHPIRTSVWCVACARERFSKALVFDLDPSLRVGDLPV